MLYFFKSKFNGDLHLDCHRSFTEKRSTIALIGHSWSEIELHGVYWNQNNNKKKRGKKEEDEKERFNNGIQYDIDIDLNYYNNNYLHKYIFIHRIKEVKDTKNHSLSLFYLFAACHTKNYSPTHKLQHNKSTREWICPYLSPWNTTIFEVPIPTLHSR